ncbi:putative lipopolysaccharide biosynthesis glycosyltransferase [Pedobacter sp. BAL39]|uniref:glycosyltransferase family 2 protein n=1 Tax=Pedobacter sp. BAL39 TaxID=391596 RepID=UPI000155970B|nr:glycosyltransferase family 2 protein [Pedobacter sp. BAL39]EDM37179.1 putative lipopolysaccharide biosynthesis glycosyltransferase [Pedobacter sp. BAL39]
MTYQITAAIVLYKNDRLVLSETIDSFLRTDLRVRLFLVDNSPTDDLRNLYDDDRVEYIFNPTNPGFGAAHNIAILKAFDLDSMYHLVLNPDIYFAEGTLEKLYAFMESDLETGHVMPKVLYPDNSIQYLCKTNPTVFDLFARRFMPSFLKKYFKERMDRYEYKDKDYNEIIYNIPYLSGCFMFLRTNTLKKVGLFDDRIFMYIEDADLTRRFLQHSKTAYYPEAIVYHHFAKGSHKNWKLTWYSIHGAFIYFNKWGWFKTKKS